MKPQQSEKKFTTRRRYGARNATSVASQFSLLGITGTLLCLFCSFLCAGALGMAPLIMGVTEGDHVCFFFDIPFDDDAHFAFSIIAKDESSDAERNAVKELMELVNSGAEKANGASAPRDARYRGESKVSVEVLSPGGDIVLDQKMQYFYPVIIRHVLTKERLDHEQLDDDDIHGEYEICVDNNSRKDVRLLMHLQLQSNDEDARHERLIRGKPRLHKKHLSPLERNVEEAVDRADHIIREMNYMAERERRMKLTSESTNKWVRRFSWMSIIVLLSVTGIQIVYLKSYFQKKKLM